MQNLPNEQPSLSKIPSSLQQSIPHSLSLSDLLSQIFYTNNSNTYIPLIKNSHYIPLLYNHLLSETSLPNLHSCLSTLSSLFNNNPHLLITITPIDNEFILYNTFISTYMKLINQFSSTQISSIKQQLLSILHILTTYINCPRSIFNNIYHNISLLTFKHNSSVYINTSIFNDYYELLYVLYKINENDKLKTMPKHYVINNGVGIVMNPLNDGIVFQKGLSMMGWLNIKDDNIYNGNKKYLFCIETNEKSIIEAYLTEGLDKVYLGYIKEKGGKKIESDIYIENKTFNEMEWHFFSFQIVIEKSQTVLLLTIFNFSKFEKPFLQDVKLILPFYKQETISKITFYSHLSCTFTSILIGYNIRGEKIIKKECENILHYGIYNDKSFRKVMNIYDSKNEIISIICTPYKAKINRETMCIEFEDTFHNAIIIIPEINPHLITDDMKFYDNNINLYHNYSSRIHLIGGMNSLLPLLEIITTQKEYIAMSSDLFEKILLLISKLLIRSKYNFINAIIIDFFPALSVFMENIPKKYYSAKICEYLLNIKNFYLNQLKYIDKYFHGKIKRYNVFLEYIFFNERIMFRFKDHLLHFIWDQIKEIVDNIFKYHTTHKETYEKQETNKDKKISQPQIHIVSELEYEHISYILTYEKFLSILINYESKTLNKHCCEKHSKVIYKKQQNQEGYLHPSLLKIIEPIENIICTLINIESLFHKKDLLQLFTLLPLDISPCLKIFLIRLLPPLISYCNHANEIEIIDKLKELNLKTYLTISLGEALLPEKVIILQTIIAIDKENHINWFDSKKEICPIIKDIIPNRFIITKETIPQVSNRLLSENFNAHSDFYDFYLKYKPFMLNDFYNFPQWISFFYPQQYIGNNDTYYDKDIYTILKILFDWFVFWMEIILENPHLENINNIRLKKNALFELLINYVIRINNINILLEFLKLLETYKTKSNKENNSNYMDEIACCQLFWLFIFENYYYYYRIINTQTQESLIGDNKLFPKETSIQSVDSFLHEICTKFNNIIQEMITCILLTGNNVIHLYYFLTWGTYQKIVYQSTSIGIKSKDKSIILLSQFIQVILEIYLHSLKSNSNKINSKNEAFINFTTAIMNIIYDFVIIFPLGTIIVLDPNDLFEFQTKNIFYLPGFFIHQITNIKKFAHLFKFVINFILDYCDIQSIFSNEDEPSLYKCNNEQKLKLLDNIIDNYIYNKNYYDGFFYKLLFLTKCDNFDKNTNDVKLIYLSFPIVKLVMHFLCCLSSINDENILTYIHLIEIFLIDLISMTTCQNNKKSKNYSSTILKEINKIIEPVIIQGFTFLLDQYKYQENNKEQYLQSLINIIYFIKKILSNKNSLFITQSPVYNIFINIIQDDNKQPFISLIKNDQLATLNEIFINDLLKQDWDVLLYKNISVIDIIKDYFGKEETLQHLMRIHCEIKEIIPIVNNVDVNDIISKSDADVFKIETNVNLALCDEKMNRNTIWEIEKTKMKKVFDITLDKMEKEIYLISQHNKKIYKNIKKELFSWNGIWSDINIFYNHPEYLLQKQLYHLTKEYTTPLLIPILDIDLYLPSFKHFDKSNLFLKNKNGITKYGVCLDIEHIISLMKSNKNVHIRNKHIFKMKKKMSIHSTQEIISNICNNNACMIKQTHHLPGVINIENNTISFEMNYNEEGSGINENNLLYDKDNKTCYGSFFKNYKKDKLKSFIKIPFNKINMIIKKKYFYCKTAFEIFTDNNKSYYFHLRSHSQRKKLFEEIKQNKDFKIIMRNCNKKDEYELLYINKKYQTKLNFKGLSFKDYIEHWATNKISNIEFIMFCNLIAGRSLRDLTQYPVFPWTLIDYNSKDLLLNFSKFRQFSLPIGMMNINAESQKRRDLFIKEYHQMKLEMEENNLENEINDNNENKLESEQIISDGNIIESCNKLQDKNISFESFQNQPYFYGTHYSNPLYVSHYLTRIFPFSQLRIELQGDNFDSLRIFSSINDTFQSVTTQKTDVRELIPEFFILPEMFININNLNLGIENTNVELPEWSNNKPYLFIKQMRKSIEYREDKYDNGINRWLDLIIGNLRKENIAKNIGNIYMYHTYSTKLPLDNYKSREELNNDILYWIDYYLRLAELGLSLDCILYNEIPPKDNRFLKSIVLSTDLEIKESKNKKLNDFFNGNKLTYLSSQNKDFQVFAISNKNEFFYFNTNILSSEDRKITKETTILPKCKSYNYSQKEFTMFQKYPILINQILIIYGGFWDGTLLLHNRINNTNETIHSKYDKSSITVLVFDKNEHYVYCGTQNGSVLIFFLHYIQHKNENSENGKKPPKKKKDSKKEELLFKTCLSNHVNEITAITINDDLNIVGTTAKDGYVNLYIIPSFKFMRSVKLKTILYSDFLFISNTPVPCFVLFNENKFVSYTINGSNIEIEKTFMQNKEMKNEEDLIFMKKYDITAYYFFTDLKSYVQYLMIGTSNGFIHIREFPEMKLYSYIKVFDNFSIDALISLNSAENEFLVYTRCEKMKNRYKIIHNAKASSENVVFSTLQF